MSVVEEKESSPEERSDIEKRPSAGAGGNVEKIRDILFGSQMRDYEKRFNRLEEKLQRESADLRDDLKKRFASLEGYIKKELEALSERIAEDERKIAQVDEQATKNHRELRQQILDQSGTLSEEIRKKHDQLFSHVEETFEELATAKVDRASLADFFTEMALRLTNQFKVEEIEEVRND